MAEEAIGSIEPDRIERGAESGGNERRIRKLFKGPARPRKKSEQKPERKARSGDGPDDPGTADPVKITEKRRRGAPRLADLTPEERAARDARKSARASSKAVPEAPLVDPASIPVTLIDQVSEAVKFAHILMAGALEAPELVLSQEKADALAKTGLNLACWYVPLGSPSGKTGAWLAFAGCAGMIYAPAIWAIIARKRAGNASDQTMMQMAA